MPSHGTLQGRRQKPKTASAEARWRNLCLSLLSATMKGSTPPHLVYVVLGFQTRWAIRLPTAMYAPLSSSKLQVRSLKKSVSAPVDNISTFKALISSINQSINLLSMDLSIFEVGSLFIDLAVLGLTKLASDSEIRLPLLPRY